MTKQESIQELYFKAVSDVKWYESRVELAKIQMEALEAAMRKEALENNAN